MIEELLKKSEVAAEKAKAILKNESLMQPRIQAGKEALSRKVEDAKTKIWAFEGNIIGVWRDGLIYNTLSESEGELHRMEVEISNHERTVTRAPAILQELEKQASLSRERVSNAKEAIKSFGILKKYQEKKHALCEAYSDQMLFELRHLERKISDFEPDLFFQDFVPLILDFQSEHNPSRGILSVPVPDPGSDEITIEKYHRRWWYEFLKFDLLSKPYTDEPDQGEKAHEVRTIARLDKHGPLLQDFEEFLTELQRKNPRYFILELR